jgi:1-aminocyclopropane-1-carboxylate deaminase/D-cysteine desulfhydrase-like pyridoxal-dependent ACC family enzyme
VLLINSSNFFENNNILKLRIVNALALVLESNNYAGLRAIVKKTAESAESAEEENKED